MMKQSLEDSIKYGNKDLDKAKKGLAAAGEAKGTAEGDLAVTSKALKADIASLAELHRDCMTKAEEFEAATKSRGEELKALAEAKKVLSSSTVGAEAQTYDLAQVSLMQLGSKSPSLAAVRFVRRLGEQQGSAALAQLAARMTSAVRSGASAEDVFSKVKGLITEMIERLLAQAQAEADKKAYCDKEMAELAKAQAEMDKLRAEEKAAYEANRPELEAGVEGVKLALKILRDYYASEGKAHEAAEGAGSTIIGLLEVAESDFTTGLCEMIATEEASAAAYDRQTKENAIEKATKDQDIKYKSKEAQELDQAVAEATSD